MSATLVGVSGPIFGTTDEAYGYVRNAQVSWDVDEETLPNGQNDIVAAAYHGKRGEITGELTVKTDASCPTFYDLASQLTLTGNLDPAVGAIACYIRNVTRVQAQGQWKTCQFTGSCFPEIAASMSTTTTTTTTA